MWLPVLLAVLGVTDPATPYREVVVAETCLSWANGPRAGEPAVHQVGEDGLCFFGSTDDENSAAFVEAVSRIDPATPLVVVVRSPGGEINAAMAMGEALVPRETTVIAQRLCASSCANYLFLAGDRRVVAEDTLLAYHGGIFAEPESYWEAMEKDFSERLDPASVEASMKASREYANNSLARQAAFLDNVDVNVDLFEWMQGLNDLPEAEQLARCAVPDAVMLIFSDAVLAEHGIVVHQNDGPQSDAEVAVALDERGSAGMACYWD